MSRTKDVVDIRDVIKRAIWEGARSCTRIIGSYDDLKASGTGTEVLDTEANSVITALAELAGEGIDAAIDELEGTAYHAGNRSHLSPSNEMKQARANLKSTLAASASVRGPVIAPTDIVIRRLPGEPLVSQRMLDAANAEFARIVGYHRVSSHGMETAIRAAIREGAALAMPVSTEGVDGE